MAREMKDSGIVWVHDIPTTWTVERNKLCFICSKEIIGDKASETQLLSLTTKGIKKKRAEESSGKVPESYDTYQTVAPNNIVMCLFDLDVSAVFSGISPFYGMISPAYRVLQCKEKILPKYADYWFSFVFDGRKFKHYSKNLRYTLTYDEFATLPIVLPPALEQKRIISFLDSQCARIDAVIEKTRASIEEYKKLKQAVITQAVTKGIRPGREMKDSGVEWIGEIPWDWEIVKIKYFASIRSGITLGKTYPRETELIEYPYLRVANVQGSYTDLSNVTTIMMPKDEAEKYMLRNGELLMTEGGDRDKLGRGTIWNGEIDPCLHQNHVFALRINESKLKAKYISFLSDSSVGRDYFDVTANQSIHLASTNSRTILNFVIPFPCVAEQVEIIEYLDGKVAEIDALISRKESFLSELEQYKKSLIFEYVTGKKEVPAIGGGENQIISIVDTKTLIICRVIELMPPKGRVHLQKALFLIDCLLGLNPEIQYIRQKHGPYDKQLEVYEQETVKKEWIQILGGNPVEYLSGKRFEDYRVTYEKHLGKYDDRIKNICAFLKGMRSSEAERVATIIASWNDFVIAGIQPTDDQILEDVLNNWTENKSNPARTTWDDTLEKIKKKKFIPSGFGKHTIPLSEVRYGYT